MRDGYIKIACATPDLKVADCEYNTGRIMELIKEAEVKGVKIVCFPELSITGYTCGDLFLQEALLDSAKNELLDIIEQDEEGYSDIEDSILKENYKYRYSIYNRYTA